VALSLRLRKKTLAVLGLTFASLIIIQYAASQMIFLNSFAALEEQDAIQNVERVISALNADIDNLDNYVYDWAAWDDTYDFIQDLNEDYIESNLLDETFIASELNLMTFVDSSGEIVFSKAFDLENEEEIAVPESIQEHFATNNVLWQHENTDSSVKGLLRLPEGLMIIVSQPIIKSNDEGPILGSLIMGYYLDSYRLETLAETTHLSVNMQQIGDSQTPTEFEEVISSFSEETQIIVKSIMPDSIAGYTLFKDIYGEPSLVLKVDLSRSIFQQGNSSISYFVLLLLTTGITFSIVVVLFLEKTVLSRLSQLNTSVKHIRSQGTPSKRVSVKSKDDEIADLAKEINEMLTTLEQSQNKLQMTNEKLSVVGRLTRHDVRNKLSVIANRVYLSKKGLTDDPKTTEHLDSIEVAIAQMAAILEFAKTYEMVGMEELTYVNVEESVQEAITAHELNNVKVVNDCGGLTVLADSLLKQIFYNLIHNSLVHGQKVTQTRVYYKEEEYQLKLIYEDDGVGIAEDEKEKIFIEGYGKGTGYGLYLIRKICEAYGWIIQETGKQGKGVKFVMLIPQINKDEKRNYYVK
jgi:sensor domain CHASE-containing protein